MALFSRKSVRLLAPVLCLGMLVLSGCGGEEETTEAPVQNVKTYTELSGITGKDLSPDPPEVENPSLDDLRLEAKSLELAQDRYIREMMREEVERTYRDQGEYIDPRHVVELLSEDVPSSQPVPAVITRQDQEDVQTSWRISYIIHNDARALFEEGNIAGAVAKWKSFITDARAFTISVEVDCDTEALKHSYEALQSLDAPVFVQSETVKGRTCYRICVGVFRDRASAMEWFDKITGVIVDAYPFIMQITR